MGARGRAGRAGYELLRRAVLKLDTISAVLLLWPEAWSGADLLGTLLQDVPKDTQRIVVTADVAASAAVVERYCWRAPVVDVLGPDWTGSPPAVGVAPPHRCAGRPDRAARPRHPVGVDG